MIYIYDKSKLRAVIVQFGEGIFISDLLAQQTFRNFSERSNLQLQYDSIETHRYVTDMKFVPQKKSFLNLSSDSTDKLK